MFRRSTPYLYLLLPMGLLAVFFFWPLVDAFVMSLYDYGRDLYAPTFAGLQNYRTLFASPGFLKAFHNSAVYVAGVVPCMMTLPILMALLVNGQLRGMALFRALLYVPVVLSLVVASIAWKWLYAQDGLLNYLLSQVGLPKVGWLTNPDIALYAVMVVVVWKGLAYYMMMYLAHLQSVSQDLYEAATIDGASLWQKHWHVTLPHLRPTMAMVALISIIGCLKSFPEIYVMTQGGPIGATETLVYYIYQRAFGALDLGVASAGGFVLMLMMLVISLAQYRWFGARSEATSGKRSQAKGA